MRRSTRHFILHAPLGITFGVIRSDQWLQSPFTSADSFCVIKDIHALYHAMTVCWYAGCVGGVWSRVDMGVSNSAMELTLMVQASVRLLVDSRVRIVFLSFVS